MKSYIDLSGCDEKVREFHKEMLRLPVKRGEHRKDVDLLMEEIPEVQRERIKVSAVNYDDEHVNRDWPVGFDVRSMPKGAVLHLVIEE